MHALCLHADFFTPEWRQKSMQDIVSDLSVFCQHDVMLTPYLAAKSLQTLCLQSHAQLQLVSFHMIRYNCRMKARFGIHYLVPCLASGIIHLFLSFILWKVEGLQAEVV